VASSQSIQAARIQILNQGEVQSGEYVLYWMQQSQRAEHNHALEYAVQQANTLQKPLLVGFGLMDDYPEANLRHYTFMLEGLQEVQTALAERGIKLVVRQGAPDTVALHLGQKASMIVTDRGYLRPQKQWRDRVAQAASCPVIQVEGDVVVPVELVSNKAEYAARTIRPKIHKHLDQFLIELQPTPLEQGSLNLGVEGLELSNLDSVVDNLALDGSVQPVSHHFRGGTSEAKRVLQNFIHNRFATYTQNRNQPQTSDVSHMSKYLHFGQISPVYLALQIRGAAVSAENRDSYLEELIVRRELPMNFVHYTPDYDAYSCIPAWAKQTLADHRDDDRPYQYSSSELEAAATHDPYWNAAMKEMKYTGYMHNYMRMYWGKKILEWCSTPEEAHRTVLALNNKYFLDGRDANSFANVAWIFGVHDRGWTERAIFGKIRYMSAGGLERKADPKAYIQKVEQFR
jgi:deoxyribodipyrimidine photo-lyase